MRSCVTLQGVEDGEQVHEGQIDGPPGEEGEAPGHAQQEGETDHTPQVPQHLLPQRPVAALAVAAADLNHDHDEHGHVHQENQREVAHARHVEHHGALDPTAGMDTEGGTLSLYWQGQTGEGHYIVSRSDRS